MIKLFLEFHKYADVLFASKCISLYCGPVDIFNSIIDIHAPFQNLRAIIELEGIQMISKAD